MNIEPPCNRIKQEQLRLYLILETSILKLPLGDFIMQAVEGGVTAIQLRDKTQTNYERYCTAKQIVSLLEDTDTLFFVNGTPDIAVAAGAHGVHLTPDDIPVHSVKDNFSNLLIGYSCNNEKDCVCAINEGADYLEIGPAFSTLPVAASRPVIGPEGIIQLAKSYPVPSLAVGGIDSSNIIEFRDTALAGIAVSSALCMSEEPYDTALQLKKLLECANERI